MEHDERVLVTGGSGFIAGQTIAHLLAEGWRVRTTVRDRTREPALRAALGELAADGERLEVVAADLNADGGWLPAVTDCAYVLHIASPFPVATPTDDEELVRPARDGTVRVLTAARAAGVRRVVLTSSTAAVAYGRGGRDVAFTETDWSDPTNLTDTSAYERSKTLAERAAWDWIAREGHDLELVTVCPGAVLGPVSGPDRSASIAIVARLLDGSVPGLARFGWPLVDVRDVADLHLRAMTAPTAAGQRYIGAGTFAWMADIAHVLRERTPALATRVPRRTLPNTLVRLSSRFDPALRGRLYELGKHRPVSANKARRELGWTPRSNEDAIIATAESLARARPTQPSPRR